MRKMKDSGIEWIGNIPEDWKIKRLKHVLEERKEKNDPIKSKDILSLSIDRGVFPYSEKTGGGNKAKEKFEDYKLAYPNDIVLNSMNVVVGSVGKSNYFGCVSPVYYTLFVRNNNYNIDYYNYIFQSNAFQKSLWGLGNGIVVKESDNGKLNTIRMRISMEKLNNIIMPVPTKDEQERIANHLNQKVDEIDNAIRKTKQTIEDYKLYKQSIITETVTKGIDKDGKMKSSGIEWINKIPEKWKVYKTKEFFEFGKGLPITKADLINDGEKVISYGQIHSKNNTGTNVKEELYRYVSDEYLKSNYQSIVKYNDFIFADTSEDLNGCGNCVYIDQNINVFAGYHTITLKTKIKDEMKYLAYLFLTDTWRSQIRSRVSGIKLFSITQKILKETTIIIPEKQERENIVKYLDKKCSEIDILIKSKENLINELENYRKSLIYEYVTGKKEVTNNKNSKGIKINCKDNIFAQAILLCKIIEKLNNYNLGRVKAEKTLYLIEKEVGFDFDNNYVREAAGPLSEAIYKCEAVISRSNKWVKVNKVKKHIEYEILSDFNKYNQYYNKYYSGYDDKIEKVIEIIKNCSTDQAEMIATLYASWNDFIIKGEKVSEIQIVKDVRENWHDRKKRFKEEEWLNVLDEMKQIELIPRGNGNLTIVKEQ